MEAAMPTGVSRAVQKNGTVYYRSGITYRNKHISLGSFPAEKDAACAYLEAQAILTSPDIDLVGIIDLRRQLSFEKAVILLNFRDNGLYFKNPIYLRRGYFSYFLNADTELKFDIDDLFYYSSHKIQRRQGHLFVSDYGMQYSILSRYGIRPYAVCGRDYFFSNGDVTDYRYANIVVVNRFHGVHKIMSKGIPRYRTVIHINGNHNIGTYAAEEKAAVAYNKAADLAKAAGITKNFPENYVDAFSPKEYAELYTSLKISRRYLAYLDEVRRQSG